MVELLTFHTSSAFETEHLAEKLSLWIRPGDLITLSGELGSGKSTFARAMVRALAGGDQTLDVPSPTFTLVQMYELPRFDVAHFDLYRLTSPDELLELGSLATVFAA